MFFKVVGLDDNLDIFFAGKNSPWRRLGRLEAMLGRWRGLCRAGAAGLCRAAGASQPLAKNAAGPPPQEDWIFFPGMPGRLGHAGQVRRNCRLRRQFRKKNYLGRIPTLARQGGAAPSRMIRMIRMIRMTRRAGVSKNMFIRHVLRHVEIKRFWWLGAAKCEYKWHL